MVYVTHDQTEAMTMADQVVLLKSGRIDQTGPPHELYEYPATTFAARFIGSPPMNLIDINLLEEIPTFNKKSANTNKTQGGYIGVRPEHIALSQNGLPVEVDTVDYLGSETVMRLYHGEQPFFIKLNGKTRFKKGDRLNIGWPEEAVLTFNAKGFRE